MNESGRTDSHVPDDEEGLSARSLWDGLVQRCAGGDQSALAELYDQSSRLVYGTALRMLANPEDAEEVTVDVYNQVWRTAASFESSRGSVSSWLVVLARSRAIDRIRAGASRARREEPIEEYTILMSHGNDPEKVTGVGQLRHRVRDAMARLPAENRRAVELAFFHG